MPTMHQGSTQRPSASAPNAGTLDRIVRRLSGARIRLTYYDLRFDGIDEGQIVALLDEIAGNSRFQFFIGEGRVVILDIGPRPVSTLPSGDRRTTTLFTRRLAQGFADLGIDDEGSRVWLAIQHGWSHEWSEAAAILRQLEAAPRICVLPGAGPLHTIS